MWPVDFGTIDQHLAMPEAHRPNRRVARIVQGSRAEHRRCGAIAGDLLLRLL